MYNMEKNDIQKFLNNASEGLLEKFFETLLNEINSDEEPYNKRAYHLLAAALNDNQHDDFFISLCGWSLETLIEKSNCPTATKL